LNLRKYQSIFVIILFALFIFSCDDDDPENCCNVDIGFELEILDADNNDLLDPDFSDSYDHSEISYYKLDENDKKIELILENHFVNPPSNESGRYFLYITGLGTRQFDGSYISYLKLSDKVTDTIKIITNENDNNLLNEKIWYNGDLIWEKSEPRLITIVK
tara:strand:- start:477 stop:959 length:483 start_codon:yes stop_codon:yes gene_type:complete